MNKTTTTACYISYAMTWRDSNLCFVFHGTTRHTVTSVFKKMSRFCGDFHVTTERAAVITGGRCYRSIVATVTEPNTDVLPEAEWPMMITSFLQKSVSGEVTYYDNFSRFLNT